MNSDPTSTDGDGDGLLDGKVIEKDNGIIVAPKDPNPIKYNGPQGIWKEHIKQMSENEVLSELKGWYKFNYKLKDILTGIGSRFLNFKVDNKNMAIHSQVNTWQEIGGYNDLYDSIFSIGTNGNMSSEKFSFSNYNDYSDEITTTLDDVRTFVDTKTSDLQGVYGLRSLETIVSSYVKVDSYLVFENNPNLKYCKIDFENDEDKATIEKLLLECEIVVRN